MWHTLPSAAQAAIDTLRRTYGAALFDYCSTALSPADAELATCGALLSAYTHAGRLVEEEQLRAWLYAVARAHRTVAAAARPASTGSWQRPGADELLPQALAALKQPQREVLDLAFRHGLSPLEIAQVFDVGAVETERLVAEAGDLLQQWVSAVRAAQQGGGCPEVAVLVAAGSSTVSRRTRTYITRHIQRCPACQALDPSASAAELLGQMPLAAPPTTLAHQLVRARPLGEETRWRIDGFPEQAHALHDVLAGTADPSTRALSRHRPATAGHDDNNKHEDRQAAPSPSTPDGPEFRAWERRSEVSAEFWARRDDEADPEARLTLRPLLPVVRVGAVITAVVGSVIAAGAAWSSLHAPPSQSIAPAAAPATITLLPEPPPNPVPEDPPAAALPSTSSSSRPAATASEKPSPARPSRRDTPRRNPSTTTKPASPRREAPLLDTGPQDPPAGSTPRPSISSAPRQRQRLSLPPPPIAKLSPGALHLGPSRTGSIALACTGTCHIASASGTSGVSLTGTRITVDAPSSHPGCTDSIESGTLTVTWRGTTTGDGRTTAGTTTAGGTLTAQVTWTIRADRGTPLLTSDDRIYWANCPNG